MNTAVKNILRVNRRTLQFLHVNYNYDFTKPFEVIEGDGWFTFNKVKKAIAERIGNTEGWNIVFLYTRKRWGDSIAPYMYVAEIGKTRFATDWDEVKADGFWKYDIDTDSIGRFEKHRKSGDIYNYYVIAQKIEYETENNRPKNYKWEVNAYDRLRVVETRKAWRSIEDKTEYVNEVRVAYRDYNYETFGIRGGYECKKTTDVIDKSGYVRTYQQYNYKERAKALRAKRAQEKANAYNCDAENAELEKAVTEMRARFTELVTNAKTANDYFEIDRRAYRVHVAVREYETYIEKYNGNRYATIDAIERARNYVIERVNDVFAKAEV